VKEANEHEEHEKEIVEISKEAEEFKRPQGSLLQEAGD
jgi:hypothetical protein